MQPSNTVAVVRPLCCPGDAVNSPCLFLLRVKQPGASWHQHVSLLFNACRSSRVLQDLRQLSITLDTALCITDVFGDLCNHLIITLGRGIVGEESEDNAANRTGDAHMERARAIWPSGLFGHSLSECNVVTVRHKYSRFISSAWNQWSVLCLPDGWNPFLYSTQLHLEREPFKISYHRIIHCETGAYISYLSL